MNRENAVQIRPNDDQWDNADLITLLYRITNDKEIVFNKVPQLKLDDIFFIETDRVVKDLFKHEGCFRWINGSVKLWHNEEKVTRFNYKKNIGEDEEVVYEYLNWEDMVENPPILEVVEEL